jgi:DUF1365 family protein
MSASAVYDGAVVHRRLSPRRHRLRYRLFQLFVDLDELPRLDRRLRLFGHNRPALFSFYDRDHGAGDGRPLRAYVEATLRDAGLACDGGPIRLLTLPRVLGYVFNPLSVYYCHRRSGELAAVLLEVTNTFGERHSYLIEVTQHAPGAVRRQCAKRFFVSPFIAMSMRYDFRLSLPSGRIATAVNVSDAAGDLVLATAFAGQRLPLTDRVLAGAFVRHPLATAKVILGIHLEALKLVLKGVRRQRKPPAPARPLTVVRSEPVAPGGQEPKAEGRAGDVTGLVRRAGLEPDPAPSTKIAIREEA